MTFEVELKSKFVLKKLMSCADWELVGTDIWFVYTE